MEDNDFTKHFPPQECKEWQSSLETFCVTHAVHHRPIAVVSSGGTVADLEKNSVRCLDNFSTGLRGAISVEEFLKRGYAVIHIWRTGSASPYARVVGQHLGLQQANHCLTVECLGRLFAIAGENEEEDLVQTVLRAERDPWLASPGKDTEDDTQDETRRAAIGSEDVVAADQLTLHRSLVYSTTVQRALQERSSALKEGRLLTVPFRSVEDYLGKLQLCAQAVQDCQALAMFFLAAAVSDFYVPPADKAEHKIQSSGSNGLTLELKPVPKVIGLLRNEWAPRAFCVSFKLETDKTILRQKANRAVEKYGCHMVIGNLLHTRHDQVWVLAPEHQNEQTPASSADWPMTAVTRSTVRSSDNNSNNNRVHATAVVDDSLESSILDVVVQAHFEFISFHFHAEDPASGIRAAEKAQTLLLEKKRKMQKEEFWKRVKKVGMEIAGGVLAIAISYSINTALQRRLRG